MGNELIFITSCTRLNESEWSTSLLGSSYPRIPNSDTHAIIHYNNKESITKCYNKTINIVKDFDDSNMDDIIVFVHDDVRIEDLYFIEKLEEGLKEFDVVGVAGGKKLLIDHRVPPSWTNGAIGSGAIHHKKDNMRMPNCFGNFSRVLTLDGVFIATKLSTLINNNIRFDEQFDFHCYDLDFSMQCYKAKLKLGTIPLHLLHGSVGDFGSEGFKVNATKFYEKYKVKQDDVIEKENIYANKV